MRIFIRAVHVVSLFMASYSTVHAEFHVNSSVDKVGGKYVYQYTVINETNDSLVGFELTPVAGIESVQAPNSSWTFIAFNDIWRKNKLGGGAGSSTIAVPEPTLFAILVFGIFGLNFFANRFRSG